jgi:DNA-directed RNA polymerase specialized sigma24 family protein
MEKEVKKKKPKKYINNSDLLREIELSHKQDRMTEELGKMVIELCKRYAKHPQYSNIYSHEEDMKAFAIMTVVKVWRSFNPEKSNNPFAYFTQILRHAFYQFGNSEKKQQDTKIALKKDLGLDPSIMQLLEMEKVSKDNFIEGFEDCSDTESDMTLFINPDYVDSEESGTIETIEVAEPKDSEAVELEIIEEKD